MAWVITKKAMQFFDGKIEENPVTHERLQINKQSFTVYPNQNNTPQEIPDWCEKDDLFKASIEDGSLVEVSEKSALAAIAKQKEQEEKANLEKKPAGLQSQWKK
jgi:hypothetical protein